MKEIFDTEEAADARCKEIADKRLTRVIHRYPEDGKFIIEYDPRTTGAQG